MYEIQQICAVPSPNFIVRFIEFIMNLFPYEEECVYRLIKQRFHVSINCIADVNRILYKFIITENGEIQFEDENAPVDLSKCWVNYEDRTFCICWKGYCNWINQFCVVTVK